ncbi:MAG TPA: 2,4'-dihydroxyacetophenone dioxygenase family protein [Gammaproteobacteria bacterium]|nr:2,4'-dihydroxyacetophenone dioxygenase family protein [Gammaproteobacteria bacterium]
MNEQLAAVPGVPAALHRGKDDLPWVSLAEGVSFQLLQADVEAGLWVLKTRFEPGVVVQRHKHTGEVYAFTLCGAWKYLEYPEINRAGSYLYEPAGSIHTLTALADNTGDTEVWFAIRGANLNLTPDGKVESVLDAGKILKIYRRECAARGLPAPDVIGA